MAKQRKQKNDEQHKNGAACCGSCADVRYQKLCLTVDMEKQRIYGHTELKLAVPQNGVIGLYASNMNIGSVLLNGVPVKFSYNANEESKENGIDTSNMSYDEAADIAGFSYLSSLEKEMLPELVIFCEKEKSSQILADNTDIGQTHANKSNESSVDVQTHIEDLRLVRISYWLEKPQVGAHFTKKFLFTNNQLRRARCWFPCVDCCLKCCSYDLEFTVGVEYMAVSNGTLLYQVVCKDDPAYKTFVYKVDIPIPAKSVTLVVGAFHVFPDHHKPSVTHMCLPLYHSDLECTINFFHSVFSYYEEYLSTSFPFGTYTQIFVDSESAIVSTYAAASVSIFSSDLLHSERVIDQVIKTRIKLAHALAQQWFGIYITAENENDGWLLQGLAGFLADCYIKRFLGNNEARYRRYKANVAVCNADVNGATALSSSRAVSELYGTDSLGFLGKIRSWKAVAILQMLEKQMGPEAFRKILQRILSRAHDKNRPCRTLSTKEFRHLANKIGNLERPFLKEFFPRWVESHGCPVLRMGFSYNKKRNIIELAVVRGCTSYLGTKSESIKSMGGTGLHSRDEGWPGMMSIRVYEFDGMFDHPSLPMAGDTYQLLEIQCHSKLASRRVQRPKKSGRAEGSDDNVEPPPATDTRTGVESPLLWLRGDPEMEYLAEIILQQPMQMWINQLEKEKDVVAQLQAIAMLSSFPQTSLTAVNALNSCLIDRKIFWRVRVEAAFALAKTATEDTDWVGLKHLIDFYKNQRFDLDIELPRPNDFSDLSEYFVLEALPCAIASVKDSVGKTPSDAVAFIWQLLKYNDNNGNRFSDAYWLSALVDSIGIIEFGQQNVDLLSTLLKHIDYLLQFDRFMPSYNGALTISCIRTLKQVALHLSNFFSMECLEKVTKFWQDSQNTSWKIRVEVIKALIDFEVQKRGVGAALLLAIELITQELSIRVQTKISVYCLRICQLCRTQEKDDKCCEALLALLGFLKSEKCFINVNMRHHIFCVLQLLAGRSATLFGISKPKQSSVKPIDVQDQQRIAHVDNNAEENGKMELLSDIKDLGLQERTNPHEGAGGQKAKPNEGAGGQKAKPNEGVGDQRVKPNEGTGDQRTKPNAFKFRFIRPQETNDENIRVSSDVVEHAKETDAAVSVSSGGNTERRLQSVKIRIKSLDSVDAPATRGLESNVEACVAANPARSSSMSVDKCTRVDATQEGSPVTAGTATGTTEVVSSRPKKKSIIKLSVAGSHGRLSCQNASTSTAKDVNVDVKCTADSMNSGHVKSHSRSSGKLKGNHDRRESRKMQFSQGIDLHLSDSRSYDGPQQQGGQEMRDKGDERKEKKRKRDKHNDAEYLERKRQKKEKRRAEKEQLQRMELTTANPLPDAAALKTGSSSKYQTDVDSNPGPLVHVQKPKASSNHKRTESLDIKNVKRSEAAEPNCAQSSFDAAAIPKQRIIACQDAKPARTMKFKFKSSIR